MISNANHLLNLEDTLYFKNRKSSYLQEVSVIPTEMALLARAKHELQWDMSSGLQPGAPEDAEGAANNSKSSEPVCYVSSEEDGS
ncbi:hypothetical protein BV898_06558 [Hypsibius exemplaris]|uniref:Uncharacterized protein n=1 Tax=Hypsibius exemplaris TaxID=2072580 RepID=A0A1W0WW64_HYPEX|nr:hypothetical protein BV898_06558 [Hypsibius exemplaris]